MKTRSSGVQPKVARLYHFEPATLRNIEYLSNVFGGKEKAVAAAIDIASRTLRGEDSELRITLK
jgi:hypothetical protein